MQMDTGKDLVKLGNKHLGETYRLGAFAPKDNPKWKGPWDCAEFVSWLAFQSTGMLVGCTNNLANPALADAYSGAWVRDAEASHRSISIGQARSTAGAVLIRRPAAGAIGHVAVSQGDGTTVEAHSHLTGVINRQVDGRRWDICMLVPGIAYPDELASTVFAPPPALVLGLREPPMRGQLVKDLQRALKAKGFDPGVIDGVLGPHTAAAVLGFQLGEGLVPDGEAGPVTLAQLGLPG
jgi:putative peptidoglycan binding protein